MFIHPIKTEKDYEAALVEIERLWRAEAGTEDEDRLDVLVTLVEAWEEQNYPVSPPDPVAAIEFRMDQEGLSPKDLEPWIGPETTVKDILAGRCGLTLEMIRKLHEELGIPAEILIRETSKPAA